MLDQGVVTILGERKQQTDDKNEKFHRVESFYGTFERSFSPPDSHFGKVAPVVPSWDRCAFRLGRTRRLQHDPMTERLIKAFPHAPPE